MKNIILLLTVLLLVFSISCTDDYDEINQQHDAHSVSDVSAKFFVTTLQQKLYRDNVFDIALDNKIYDVQVYILERENNIDEALEIINKINPKKTLLTHISHNMGFHEEVCQKLPDSVTLAYDGLVLEVN